VFEPCIKRKQTEGVRHTKSMVCTIHHNYIKCQTCSAHIHEGCHVLNSSGLYSMPQRGVPWNCRECTLKPIPQKKDVKPEVSEPGGGASKVSDSAQTKCMFNNKSELLETLRQMRWKIRSSNLRHLHCVCAEDLCKTKFKVKCVDTDTDGMWCSINMPSEHECSGGKRIQMPVTSRVCNLPIDVYREIQKLACCKAFKPSSIQTFIKSKFGITVDTTLIYNIGYRARSKLGIGDMEELFSQQKVTVYTFSISADT
jgi:hypothetical protein